MRLQENPNAIPEGETPHAVSMFAFDALLDVCKPGDRISVTGIYKAVPMRTSPRLRSLKVLWGIANLLVAANTHLLSVRFSRIRLLRLVLYVSAPR